MKASALSRWGRVNVFLVKNLPPKKILDAIDEVHRGDSPMPNQIARKVVRKNFVAARAIPAR